MIRGLVSEAGWARLEPFVSRGAGSGHPPKDHILVLSGVFRIARAGTPQRDVPDYFGK